MAHSRSTAMLLTGLLATVTLLAGCGDDDDAAADAATDQATSLDGGNVEAWCLGWTSRQAPDADLQTAFEAMLASAEALEEVAPDEIAEESQTWAEMERAINEHIASYDWDPNAPFLVEETALRDQALTEIEAYAERTC